MTEPQEQVTQDLNAPVVEKNFTAAIYTDRSVSGRAKSDQEAKTYLQSMAEQRAKDEQK